MKDAIAGMLEPHELPEAGDVITVAPLELGILRVGSTEKSGRALFEGVLKKVSTGHCAAHDLLGHRAEHQPRQARWRST